MADYPMKVRRSYLAGTPPLPGQVAEGQLAVNITDRKIYIGDNVGGVVDLTLDAGTGLILVGNALNIADTDVVAGTYTKVMVNAQGQVTMGSDVTATDISNALSFVPYDASNPAGYISGNELITLSGDATGSGTTNIAVVLADSGVISGTYGQVTVDSKGRVTSGSIIADVVYGGTGVATLTGLVKGNGTSAFTSAVAGTDYAAPTVGTAILSGNGAGGFSDVTIGSGLDFTGGTLSATNAGSGTVTNVSIANANGLDGSVANPTTTPVITLSVTASGVLKGVAGSMTAATAGTDYSAGTAALATGILKSTTGTGTLSVAVAADFPILNQSTTGNAATVTTNANLTGDVTSVGNATTLGSSGVSAGTYGQVTVDTKGRVTTGTVITDVIHGGTGVATLTGLVKGNGATAFTAAIAGTDFAAPTSGAAILSGNAAGGFANVVVGSGLSFSAGTLAATGSGGSVTSVSIVNANGFNGSVATATTTPAITLTTSITGILKGNAGSLVAAVAVDFPILNQNTTGNAATATLASTVTTNANLTGDVTSVGNATTLGNSGVTAGTYGKVTVDVKGRVTSGVVINTVPNGGTGVATISGLIKGNGAAAFTVATAGTDYAAPTVGSSILSGNGIGGFTNVTIGSGLTFSAGTLSAAGGTGTVTSVTVANANGFNGSVATPSTTPAITLTTSITGVLKGSSNALVAAIAGTDYSVGTSGLITGILKSTTGTGTHSIAVAGTDFAVPTSGSAILSGNAAGGFSNVTVGSGLTFSGGTLSATGVVTSVAGRTGAVVLAQADIGGLTTASSPTFAAVTATTFNGNATTATNVAGGVAGAIHYQSAPGVSGFSAAGTVGQVLISGGTGAPTWGSGGGSVTTVSVVSANGFNGSVATATTTPAITLSTSITGMLKGAASALTAATAGIDYTAGTSALATGILKNTTGTGAHSIAVAADFPTLNQDTTGNAGNVTGIVSIPNGGSGQITASAALLAFGGQPLNTDLSAISALGAGAGTGVLTRNPGTNTDANYSSVALLVHGNGTNGATIFTDNSPNAFTPLSVSGVTTSTAQSKFLGSSILLTSPSSAGIKYAASTLFNIGQANYTVEFWINPNDVTSATQQTIFNFIGASTQNPYCMITGANIYLRGGNTGPDLVTTSAHGMSVGVWYHWAVVKIGSAWTLYKNGVLLASGSGTVVSESKQFVIGSGGAVSTFNGYIQDVRLTAGVSRSYPTSVPTLEYPNSAAGDAAWVFGAGGGGSGTVTTTSVVSANGFSGSVANPTTTPAITLSTTASGVLKGAAGSLVAAVAGTDYAAPTSGSAILFGNGAGGFSNVTVGSGLSFSAGTLSATGGGSGTVTSASVVSANGFSGSVATATTTPAITLSTTVSGLLKGSAGSLVAAVAGTDYAPVTSGSAILSGNGVGGFANVTVGSGLSFSAGTLTATASGGSVTTVSVVAANGFSGSVATATSTPAITLTTSVSGVLKGSASALVAAVSGTDYSAGTAALATGILKSTTGTGVHSIAVAADFPILNQSTTGNAATSTTASTVTTNANMTGDVTSVGNATTLAASGVTAGTYGNVTVDAKGRTTAGSNTYTVTQILNGASTVPAMRVTNVNEIVDVVAAAPAATQSFFVASGAVQLYTTAATTNWTINFAWSAGTSFNTAVAVGDSVSVTMLTTQGASAFFASAFQVDGVAVTPKWLGGTAPAAGNASGIDAYTFTIIKTAASTYTILAAITEYK